METFEFASDAWCAALFEQVRAQLGSVDLSGISWSQSEEFADPPEHLRPPNGQPLGWTMRIRDGRLDLSDSPADDVDFKVTASYDVIAPAARIIFAEADDLPSVIQSITAAVEADPQYQTYGDKARTPPELQRALAGIHDEVARMTR